MPEDFQTDVIAGMKEGKEEKDNRKIGGKKCTRFESYYSSGLGLDINCVGIYSCQISLSFSGQHNIFQLILNIIIQK